MRCNEFRQWFQDHESVEINDSVREHLDACDGCRHIFALDQSLETKIRVQLQQVNVPSRLQERLAQNLPQNKRLSKKNLFIRWGLPPALALAALVVFFLLPFGFGSSSFASMDELGRLAIIDHTSHGTEGCSSEAVLDIGAWSLKELGYRVNQPAVPEGTELLAVTKCRLGDCDTVHLIYSREGRKFSIFIFPEKEVGFTMVAGRSYSLDFGEHQVRLHKAEGQVQAMVI